MIGISVKDINTQRTGCYLCRTFKTYKQALNYYEIKCETKLTPGKNKDLWLDEHGHELTRFTIPKKNDSGYIIDLTDMDKYNPTHTRYSPADIYCPNLPRTGHVFYAELLEACGKIKNLKRNPGTITDWVNNFLLDSKGRIPKEYAKTIPSSYAMIFLEAYIKTYQSQKYYQNNSVAFSILNTYIAKSKQARIDYSKANTKAKNDYIKRLKEIIRGEGYVRGKTATAKRAFLYLYNINDTHLGYGITVDIRMRDRTHQKTFEDYGYKGRLIYLFEGTGKEIEQAEHDMKQALELTSLPLEGFRTEATHLKALEEVLNKFTKNLNLKSL